MQNKSKMCGASKIKRRATFYFLYLRRLIFNHVFQVCVSHVLLWYCQLYEELSGSHLRLTILAATLGTFFWWDQNQNSSRWSVRYLSNRPHKISHSINRRSQTRHVGPHEVHHKDQCAVMTRRNGRPKTPLWLTFHRLPSRLFKSFSDFDGTFSPGPT